MSEDDLYDDAFFAGNLGTVTSARIVFPWVVEHIHPESVIDVGCGVGAWAFVAKESGCVVRAVDGYVGDRVLVPDDFTYTNLLDGYQCRDYDLAICLEVGEHLPATAASTLVEGLCGARFVLWSAAPPLQGGAGHINEQWPTWWEPLFNRQGYVGSCDIRRQFWDTDGVEWCYRQNMILWATPEDLARVGLTQGVLDEVHPLIPWMAQPPSA